MSTKIFEPFNRLPLEVRCLIWRTSLEPRTVSVVWNSSLLECVTPEIPSILHVSREARDEGLRMYTQNHTQQTLETNNKIFFNYDVDTTVISCTHYGVSFLDGMRDAKASMSKHHQLVRFVAIDWFNLDFAPGLAITDAASYFPLLEGFSVTDCREDRSRNEQTIEILNSSNAGQERMPILRCLRNGYECHAHGWFKAWNECQPIEVESWGKAFDWVNQRMRHRYYRGARLDHVAGREQMGLPLDIADINDPTST